MPTAAQEPWQQLHGKLPEIKQGQMSFTTQKKYCGVTMISSLKIATYCWAAAGGMKRILRIIKQRVENRRGKYLFHGVNWWHADVSGALCSFHPPSQRDASRSQWSLCSPACWLFLISARPTWTRYWQTATHRCLQIAVSSTALKSSEMPPASSSTVTYSSEGMQLGFCVRTNIQLPQASLEFPTGLDFCCWGWQQLLHLQEFSGKRRGSSLHRSTIPSTSKEMESTPLNSIERADYLWSAGAEHSLLIRAKVLSFSGSHISI